MEILGPAANIGLYFVPFLFSLCFHEYAHGWMAKRLGDNTASVMGRLTMNPMAHADLVGTVILPIMAILTNIPFFGWAKPVPVNERNLKHPRKDMFWVASAGPGANLLLALVGAFALGLVHSAVTDVSQRMTLLKLINTFILINLSLAFFNLIPVHPLDGGKVLARFLPEKINDQLEANQHISSMLLLVLFVGGGLRVLAYPIYWAHQNLLLLVEYVLF